MYNEVFIAVPNTHNRYYASSYGYIYDMKLKKSIANKKN